MNLELQIPDEVAHPLISKYADLLSMTRSVLMLHRFKQQGHLSKAVDEFVIDAIQCQASRSFELVRVNSECL
jgi:hypothetical protein